MSLTEDEIRQMREKLWAGYVITREQIVDGFIPLEHLEGTPGWTYDPNTGNWYNDARCAEFVLEKAAKHFNEDEANKLRVPMREKPEITGENVLTTQEQPLFSIDFGKAESIVSYDLEHGVLVEVYDEGGRLTDLVIAHAEQKAYWAGRGSTWEPPIPDRESGLVCMNCGGDRGHQKLCENCHMATKALVVVDGKIVK